MRYYPINLDVKSQKCLIIGGGGVGTRKALTLLECGAAVTVISPEATDTIRELAVRGDIQWMDRPYKSSDMEGMFLVFGASDNREVNRQARDDARRLGILCNIADQPDACDFTLPALINRGDLIITVSTSGKSPAMSRKLRKELEGLFGPEYAEGLQLLGAVRDRLLAEKHDPEIHKGLFRQILDQGLIQRIRDRKIKEIDALLLEIFGQGYTIDRLMAPQFLKLTGSA
jgi:precorrin-2 dehydrogenase/sirohydrochlorin ferrochelatase